MHLFTGRLDHDAPAIDSHSHPPGGRRPPLRGCFSYASATWRVPACALSRRVMRATSKKPGHKRVRHASPTKPAPAQEAQPRIAHRTTTAGIGRVRRPIPEWARGVAGGALSLHGGPLACAKGAPGEPRWSERRVRVGCQRSDASRLHPEGPHLIGAQDATLLRGPQSAPM
jgi:hypothetical protein